MSAITADSLLRTMREARLRLSAVPDALGPIIETAHAVSAPRPVCWVTLPRPSRHRSRRVRKKLLKRSARYAEIRDPLMFTAGGRTFAHPSIVAELKREVAARGREMPGNPLFRGVMGGMW